ncbi:MAG: hypothetical protein LBE36_08130 [Flavobacteriaceae bacterium]|jgi:hypothetical protein|nr:hypothetical protein [Flavobacteriaceae bacterium]
MKIFLSDFILTDSKGNQTVYDSRGQKTASIKRIPKEIKRNMINPEKKKV